MSHPSPLIFSCLIPVLAATAPMAAEPADHEHHGAPAGHPAEPAHDHHDHAHGHDDGADKHDGEAEGHHDEVALAVANLAAFGIVIEPVTARVIGEPVIAPGWASYDPQGECQVGVATPGRIVAIAVGVGATVAAGDPLAEVLSPGFVEAQNDWLVKRAAVGTATLAVDQALAAVERGKRSGDGISRAEQQRREFELEQARQARIAVEVGLATARNTLLLMAGEGFDFAALADTGVAFQTLRLRAPAAGTVIGVDGVRGQQVAPEGGPLVTIADPGRVRVVVQVPEALLSQIRVGSAAEVTGFSGTRLTTGIVGQVSSEIDPHTRTGRVRIMVVDGAALRPGMYVQAAIVPASAAGAPLLAVPESALQPFEGKTVVFVAERTGDQVVFRPRAVSTGPVQGGHAPVLAGLRAGEPVVVAGAFLLAADLGKEGAAHEH